MTTRVGDTMPAMPPMMYIVALLCAFGRAFPSRSAQFSGRVGVESHASTRM
ncbi:hypothetical protein VFPFJ_03723 [Purpureocillium lilacinum]|uniref:Uncharacterized protein n=1 Tax=Purpureocillium lilacinum TaxID=33203 RepID=A0A179HRK3_PURLI|nr:hypothetical protein VFPFJ_03723 [Purpureocillium lilacinum]OAQ91983.1 hypothetical protein VFPFJ_03723 [Purpureocillium lilacinum]